LEPEDLVDLTITVAAMNAFNRLEARGTLPPSGKDGALNASDMPHRSRCYFSGQLIRVGQRLPKVRTSRGVDREDGLAVDRRLDSAVNEVALDAVAVVRP
jgi:hypothetical protein